jgi:hypothetical protein
LFPDSLPISLFRWTFAKQRLELILQSADAKRQGSSIMSTILFDHCDRGVMRPVELGQPLRQGRHLHDLAVTPDFRIKDASITRPTVDEFGPSSMLCDLHRDCSSLNLPAKVSRSPGIGNKVLIAAPRFS